MGDFIMGDFIWWQGDINISRLYLDIIYSRKRMHVIKGFLHNSFGQTEYWKQSS